MVFYLLYPIARRKFLRYSLSFSDSIPMEVIPSTTPSIPRRPSSNSVRRTVVGLAVAQYTLHTVGADFMELRIDIGKAP